MTDNRAARRWTRAVSLAIACASLAGCATHPRVAAAPVLPLAHGSVAFGTFATLGVAQLSPPTPVSDIHAIGDAVYIYTKNNTVYSLSQGLDIRFIRQVVPPGEALRPPVMVGDDLIFPSTAGMMVYTKTGQETRTIKLRHPLSSDVHVDQRGLLLAGTASQTGGRVAVLDPTKSVRSAVQETLIGNVRSAPVALQGIVFAATDKGRVYAIGTENRAAWAIEDSSFNTGRPIEADLVIDDFALYVASTDLKLYALDRGTGKIKWRYAAEEALRAAPYVTKDRVYQVVPNQGLAAIDKLTGKLYREPLWIAPDVTQVIAADDKFVYATQGTSRIVALGIADGAVKFSATGQFNFVTAGTDAIFAASTDGTVVKLKRGPYTGDAVAAR